MEESLILKFDASSADPAAVQIDNLTKSSDRAANSLDDLVGSSGKAAKDGIKATGSEARSAGQMLAQYAGQWRTVGLFMGAVAGVAVTVGATVKAAAQAYRESTADVLKFNQSLINSGNAAGGTVDHLKSIADGLSRIAGRKDAIDVLTSLASSGKVASDQLRGAADVALRGQKLLGIQAEDTAKAFIALGERPAAAIRALNDRFNFLTNDVYKQIRALEAEGRTAEAAALAQRTFHDEMDARISQAQASLNVFQRAGQTIGGTFKNLWRDFVGVFKAEPIEDELRKVEAEIQRILSNPITGGRYDNSARLKQQQERRQELQSQVVSAQTAAKEQADAAAKAQAAIAATDAAIEASRKASELRRNQLGLELTSTQQHLKTEVSAFANQATILEAQRDAKLISEKAYYDKRRSLAEESNQVQIKALDDEQGRLKAQTARVVAEAQVAQAAVDRMRDGGGPQLASVEEEAVRKQSESTQVQVKNATRLLEIDSERTQVVAQLVALLQVLGVQQTASADAQRRSMDEANRSAQEYLATVEQQYRREQAGQFSGDKQRQFDSGRSAIEDRYAQQKLELERDRRNHPGAIDEGQYQERLAIIANSLGEELRMYEKHWNELKAGETNWMNGASEVLRNYMDEGANSAKLAAGVVTNVMQGAEDAWVKFVTTGKLSFRDLANSVIADMARIQAKQLLTNLAGMFLGGLTGGAASTGPSGGGGFQLPKSIDLSLWGRAKGGPIYAGTPYIVGEEGPEMIVPDHSGYVMPNHQLRSAAFSMMAMGGGLSSGMPKITIINQAPGVRHEVQSITRDEIVLIAKDEVERGAPKVIAAHLGNPNSPVSKSLSRNTTAGRQRS